MVNVPGHYLTRVSSWRRLAAATWRAPDDATMYAELAIDLIAARAFLAERSGANGERLTITHLVIKALGDTLRRHPSCNLLVRRGRLFQRDHVSMSVACAIPPADGGDEQQADLTEVVLREVDQMSLEQIAVAMRAGARAKRAHEDADFNRAKAIMDRMPPWLLYALLRVIAWFQFDWNVPLGFLGMPRDPFGGAMVTNIGTFGIRAAFPPLVPFMRIPIIVAIGEAEDRAVVRDGQVAARPILPIYATIDHRVLDGFQGGRLIRDFKAMLERPSDHFAPAGAPRPTAGESR